MSPLLQVEGVAMHFGGLVALDHLDLTVARGELVSIIGPNGSGKSTLFNVISGFYSATRGRVMLDGEDITRASAHRLRDKGIARTFQSSRLFLDLSVLDNIIIGMHTEKPPTVLGVLFRPANAGRELNDCARRAEALLGEGFGTLYEQRHKPAGTLAQADRRRLEIVRSIARGPKLLLLDEPSVGMAEAETQGFIDDIARLRVNFPDLAIALIEHDMRVVEAFPDNVICIDQGRVIVRGDFSAVRKHALVQEAYLGKAAHADA